MQLRNDPTRCCNPRVESQPKSGHIRDRRTCTVLPPLRNGNAPPDANSRQLPTAPAASANRSGRQSRDTTVGFRRFRFNQVYRQRPMTESGEMAFAPPPTIMTLIAAAPPLMLQCHPPSSQRQRSGFTLPVSGNDNVIFTPERQCRDTLPARRHPRRAYRGPASTVSNSCPAPWMRERSAHKNPRHHMNIQPQPVGFGLMHAKERRDAHFRAIS